MFSSKELISFVFANENDTYYGEDLLKLDLNQYLWEQLHESYDAVYFLSAGDKSFRVHSYGDLCCDKYTPKKFKLFGGTPQQEQGKWLLEQLRAKPGRTAAFVCPLEDFCAVLSDSRWDGVLSDIVEEKKRSGIFVLTASATAEQTSALLLESPVFEKLHQSAVTDLRGGALRELYGTLQKRKADSCLFLNTFSWERVHGLLLHLALEYPDRVESSAQLDALTDYLHAWLTDPEAAGGELLSEELPSCYLPYEKLYEQLRSEHIWKRLEEQSSRYAQSDRRRRERESSAAHVPVLRDIQSYAGRCLKLRLPKWLPEGNETEQHSRSLLQNIHSAVRSPKNRIENKQITSATGAILDLADTVRPGDTDTLVQVLSALKFCVTHVYTAEKDPAADKVLDIIEKHRNAIAVSGQCFQLRQELERARAFSSLGTMEKIALMKQEAQLESLEQLWKKHTDLIRASELGLNTPATTGNIQNLITNLEQDIKYLEELPQEQEYTPEPDILETEEEPEEQEPEENAEIDEEEVNWAALYDGHAPINYQ